MKEVTNLETQTQLSHFCIPFFLNKSELERLLNEQIKGTIFNDRITEGNLQITVKKADDIQLHVNNSILFYVVPLRIIVKKTFIMGDVEVEGGITLRFQTNFSFNKDWTIHTKTQISDYQWIKKPKANLMGFSIPITAIVERMLNARKEEFAAIIDQQIKQNINLQVYAQQIWDFIQKPIPLIEAYQIKLRFTPLDFSIAPFKTEGNVITSSFYTEGKTEIEIGGTSDLSLNRALIPLESQEKKEKSLSLNVLSEIRYSEVEKIILTNFKGEKYNFGKSSIQIEDLRLAKAGKYLMIKVKTIGLYNDWLSLQGIPIYNATNKQIEVEDLSFNLDTDHITLNAEKWLLNGLFKTHLQGNLNYSLAEDLETIKKMMQKQLDEFKIQEGIHLEGKIDDLELVKAVFEEKALNVQLQINGALSVKIETLPTNNQ